MDPGDEEPPLAGLAACVCSGLLCAGAPAAPGTGAPVAGGTHLVHMVEVIVSVIVDVERVVRVTGTPFEVTVSVTGQVVTVV